ncbi:MAG: helix-turn-helix domain-containing protein [Rikenellaceae bacterium]
MEIKNIEKCALESMLAHFDALTHEVEQLCRNAEDRNLDEWMDATTVCCLLNIKKRQLQNYRDSGKIGFSKIGNVIVYHPDDVAKLLKVA